MHLRKRPLAKIHFSANWKLATATLAIAVFCTCTGCKKSHVDPFPKSGTITGWQKTGDTRVFAAKDLWQYIDGGAEQYVNAGVVSAATSDYNYRNQVDAVADVYTMGDSAGAHKIFSGEQSKEGQSIALGDEAIAYGQSVVFRKGPYLVRILAYESAPVTEQALLELAHGIEAKL
jgi:Family of unknown function (DUF6599)